MEGLGARIKRALYEEVRYEVGRWPLWRWDQNLRYIAKSLAHRPGPVTHADAEYYDAMAAYLRHRSFPPIAGGTTETTIAAVGDLMWLRDGYDDFLSPGLKGRLGEVDGVFANLETPVDPSQPVKRWVYETLRYNAPPGYLDAWGCTRPGVPRVFSVCNNHALDQGIEGLKATRREVEARPSAVCVGGANALEQAVTRVKIGELDVAVVATTFGINHAEELPTPPAGVPLVGFGDPRVETDWNLMETLLAQARRGEPDWIVLMPHWGYEYEYWPDAAMRADAHRLVQMGFDIVLGTSPHVLQPVDVVSIDGWDPACPVQVRRGGRPRPGVVAYSLGNFASVIPTVGCQTGVLLRLGLGSTADGTPTLSTLEATPTVCMRGLGPRWLQVCTVTLEEYRQRARPGRPWEDYARHARHILGPVLTPECAKE